MRICLISREYPPDTGWGGIGTYTFHLAHGLAERGHVVHVLAQGFGTDRQDADGPVTVHRLAYAAAFHAMPHCREWGLRLEHSFRVYRKLRRIIADHAIDIVEAPNFSGEGFVYSLRKTVPLVTRLHTDFSGLGRIFGWRATLDHRLSCAIEDAAILRSDLVTCSTRGHGDGMAQALGMDPARIARIPLGVPLPDPKEDRNLPKLTHPAILFVGRLERRKGIHTLIEAVPRVLDEIPEARFCVIGRDTYNDGRSSAFEGDGRHSFKAGLLRILPASCRPHVTFLGYVEPEALGRYYAACDLFVAPSIYESFGFIYLEAMSYGKPVVGCSVGGVPEVVEDGVTGVLVPPEDPLRLSEAIVQLLREPALRRQMAQQARERVVAHFTRDRMVSQTEEAYRRLIR